MEDTKKEKGATLFGENFMEKAAKRMDASLLGLECTSCVWIPVTLLESR